MVTPGMLQNPSVRTWLGDVVPAWTLLDQAGLSALRHPPHPRNGPIRFATDLSPEEIHLSAIARNTLILLHAAEIGSGLKLTATGNLSRTVVAEMLDLFSWPDLDKAEAFGFNKVINEPDFLPLFLVRHLVQAAGLVKRWKDRLKLTAVGRQSLQSPGRDALQALLFHVAFWGMDLSYLGRGPIDWPQRDIGVVLWSLSVAANQWQSSARLTRLCTIPVNGVIEFGVGCRRPCHGSDRAALKCTTASAGIAFSSIPQRRICLQSTFSVLGMVSGNRVAAGPEPSSNAFTVCPACRPHGLEIGHPAAHDACSHEGIEWSIDRRGPRTAAMRS